MIELTNRLKELLDLYKSAPTDELAHKIVYYLQGSLKSEISRMDIILRFLEEHCSAFAGPCQTYVDNVPGKSGGEYYIDSHLAEQFEVICAANKIKSYIKNNFSN